MEIHLAKTAGFCFGVNRAVELTYGLLAEGHKVATLGPLIHNPQAVEDMQRKGAQVVDTVQDVPAGCEVVIRSHGVPRSVYDELEANGIPYHDATCPFVKKIQNIAAKAEADGLFQRKALGALDQNGAQHAAVHGGDGQDADELAAARALGQLQDHQLKQADHRYARKVHHRAKLGAVGQRGEEAARIKGQRSHQYLRDAEHQREPPAAGPLVADQLDKAGNAEAAGEDGILGKDGQHRVAEEHAHKMQHFAHSFSSFPLSWLWGCTAR